jgi:hypothetical protein
MTTGTGFDATIAAFEAVCADARRRRCRSGYFAAMYAGVTRAVRQRADAGHFPEPARMERFVAAFAKRYLDAYEAWQAGQPTTKAWEVPFAAAGRWRPSVAQHLLLGMNAHINLDLGIVAAQLAEEHGGLETIGADFEAINGVLASLVDHFEGLLGRASPWFGLVDKLGGEADEVVIRFSLRRARDAAWQFAQRLAALPATQHAAEIERVDDSVGRLAERVLHPGGRVAMALFVVRLRETKKVVDVIDTLSVDAQASAVTFAG